MEYKPLNTPQNMQAAKPAAWYGKESARFVSGIAILLMIAHHFFGFKEYLRPDVDWIPLCKVAGIEIERYVAAFGKICVSLFAFNSGYVLWTRSADYSLKKRTTRLLNFLIGYWLVCCLFLLYALASGDNLPSLRQLMLNLIGLETGPFQNWVNVTFAWYVAYYIAFILLVPLLLAIFKSRNIWMDIAGWIVISIFTHLMDKVLPNVLSPLPMGAFGILAAKWAMFERLNKHMSHLSCWIFAGLILIVAAFRQGFILTFLNKPVYLLLGGVVEAMCVLLFIFSIVTIKNKTCGNKNYFGKIGDYGMNLWFMHGIFFTSACALQPYLYAPRYSILVYLWGVACLLPVAWLLKKIQSKLRIKNITLRFHK